MNEQGDQGQPIPGPRGPQGPLGGQGIEGPPGTSAEGAQGVQGERGERGRRAPMRWAPAVGYVVMLLLLLSLGFYTINRLQTSCVDARASVALRQQWARVADIIEGSQRKPDEPGYIAPKDASKQFADSYRQAIEDAGPAPDCRNLLP